MYMYKCIYVYMYICIYVYMYICIYVYIYVYIYMYKCIYVYMFICIYVYMNMNICIYVYVGTCIHACMHTYWFRSVDTQMHTICVHTVVDTFHKVALFFFWDGLDCLRWEGLQLPGLPQGDVQPCLCLREKVCREEAGTPSVSRCYL